MQHLHFGSHQVQSDATRPASGQMEAIATGLSIYAESPGPASNIRHDIELYGGASRALNTDDERKAVVHLEAIRYCW